MSDNWIKDGIKRWLNSDFGSVDQSIKHQINNLVKSGQYSKYGITYRDSSAGNGVELLLVKLGSF